jgi:signal transduction histidine kinase
MGGQGVLHITVRPDSEADAGRPPMAVSAAAPGVNVEVCDSGPGIPEDVRARIFEPFFTTKDVGAGSGLGLHIVRSIVDRHAGRIDVASAPGHTCFSVTLPGRLPPTA